VKNPLRSEAEAFQFLVGAVVYFGLIAIAGVINAWAGLAVFIVLSVIVVLWWLRARRNEVAPKEVPRSRSGPDERRILVIANETVGGRELRDRITERAQGQRAEVLVVTPALNTPLRHFTSDVDGARAYGRPGSRLAARSATATPSRRSRTRYGRSAPTR